MKTILFGLFVYLHYKYLEEMRENREENKKLYKALIKSHTASAMNHENYLESVRGMDMKERQHLNEIAMHNRFNEEIGKLHGQKTQKATMREREKEEECETTKS